MGIYPLDPFGVIEHGWEISALEVSSREIIELNGDFSLPRLTTGG